MSREVVEPTITERHGDYWETHPAFGMIGASRVTGHATLFDSEIKHQHFVTVKIETAERSRDLNRDWIHGDKQIIEVAMSEAQWASFVSSMNSRSVPCTIEHTREDGMIPGMPFAPRMQQSMDEVRGAAEKAVEGLREAFAAVEEKPNKGNIRTLKYVIENLPANMEYAASSLTEHAENVVQKAKVDIEAMVAAHAKELGIDPGEVGLTQLTEGDPDDKAS